MATEEILLKYRADITDLQAKITVIESSIRKTEKAFVDSQKSVQESFKANSSAADFFSNKLKDLGKLIIGAFAVEKIISFGKESVHAFLESELGAQKLRAAISAQGGLSADFGLLDTQAKELEKKTIFSDEAIRSAQTLALQFGLTSDATEKLIPLISDFASATGQDLQSALSAVLRGVEGNARALKIYGVQVDSTATRQQNFASITQQLTDKFKGQSEAVGATAAGTLKRLENAYDNLKEKVGAFILPAVEGFSRLADAALKFVEAPLSETLEKEQHSFELVQVELNGLNVGSDRRVELIKKLQQQYPEYLGNLNAEKVSNEELNKALDKVNNSLIIKIALQKQDEQIEKQQEKTGDALARLQEARAGLADKLNTLLKQTSAAASEFNKEQLRGLPIELQAQEILNGNIKLREISSASLSGLAKASKDVRDATIDFSAETLKSNDLQKKRITTEKDLIGLLGIEASAQEKASKTGLEKETEEERRKRLDAEKKAAEAATKLAEDQIKAQAALREFTLKSFQDNIKAEFTLRRQQAGEQIKDKQELADRLLQIDIDELESLKDFLNKNGEDTVDIDRQIVDKRIEQIQRLKDANKDAATQALKDIQDEAKTKIEVLSKVKDDPKTKIDEEAQAQKQIISIRKISVNEQILLLQGLRDAGIISEEDYTKELKRLSDEQTLIKADANALQLENDKKTKEKQLENLKKLFDDAQNVAQSLAELDKALLQNKIDSLDSERQAQDEAFDKQQEAIDKSVERRLITEGQGEARSAELKKKRAESEKKSADEVNKVKRKQAEIDKLLSIFKIGLILAEAIADLNVVKAIAAGAELAIVIATPIPKFHTGKRAKQSSGEIMSIVREDEDIFSPQVSKEYRETFEAIHDKKVTSKELNQFVKTRKATEETVFLKVVKSAAYEKDMDRYVMKHFLVPALKEQQQKYEQEKQKSFAENVGQSIVFNGLTYHDMDYIRRKGTKISNEDSLAKKISKEVAKEIVRAQFYEK